MDRFVCTVAKHAHSDTCVTEENIALLNRTHVRSTVAQPESVERDSRPLLTKISADPVNGRYAFSDGEYQGFITSGKDGA